MTKIDPSMYLDNQSKAREPRPELGKEDFLKILMTQLQDQDPTEPMDDREFVSQMATFSSLEQMTNMTDSMDQLVESQLSPVVQYSHMIGQEVSYQEGENDTEEEQEPSMETSQVTAVSQKDNQAMLELDNGKSIAAESIMEVHNPLQEDSDDSDTHEVMEEDPVEGNS